MALTSLLGLRKKMETMRKKEPSQAMLETVIISYYRGTTQIDVSSTFSCTNIHSWFITGSVPVGAYSHAYQDFGPPSKGHSTISFIRLPTNCRSLEWFLVVYSSFSSVLMCLLYHANADMSRGLFFIFSQKGREGMGRDFGLSFGTM